MSACGDSMTEYYPVFVSDTMRDPTYDEPNDPASLSVFDGRGRAYCCPNFAHCSCGCTCTIECEEPPSL